jgi:4-hydroxy-2-oxoheptanedioate aldolase
MKRSTDERSLRRRLLDDETLYGLVIKAPAPALVEMCAAAGFDFAFIDGEHGSGEALELEHHVRAAESFGMPAVVRIASHQPSEILRALDIGAEGIIIPHVNTRAEAEAVVKAAHYPPIGRRGLATTTRAGRHAFCNLKEHLRSAEENTLIAVQVEDPDAIEHVEEIASVRYIDCVFIGPADLSIGLGYPGESTHPVVVEAFNWICSAVASKPNVKLGAFARDAKDGHAWIGKGASFVALASTLLIAQKFREVIDDLRSGTDSNPAVKASPSSPGSYRPK